MKKLSMSMLIFLILAWTLFPGIAPIAKAAVDTKQHWAEPIIDRWTSEGLIKGYEDGTFQPDHSITRAEIAALINRKFKLTSTREMIPFPDLANNEWQFESLGTAAEVGYISGYEDGTIRPNEAVTRQQLAVIIANLLRLETMEDVSFIDSDEFPKWSKKEIAAVVAHGIMDGYSDLTFARLEQ
ncbi:S-layer homology domain-containing protein [Paenibacillus sp. 1_12]|uniref:S-layer homology domain-containing protein n=1 Tax=Paenibacillus sp. 1_12 TaxID=1566278 RepID=UPI0008EA510C|nr:S-layer homology domain-containing protein [Paenibacillus sp. 1_12]SFM15127.1 S-layer homology domain-containing protein [Paenibacillus sp. 1_12]